MELVANLAVVFYLTSLCSLELVQSSKPRFLSEPNKVMLAFQGESINFTWKISNDSAFDKFHFGTWKTDHGIFGNTLFSLTRVNDSQFLYYTSSKDTAKEYIGRLRWVGDIATGVASLELSNLKHSDQKYYGVEVDFNDEDMTELKSFTQLVVKATSIFTYGPGRISQAAQGSASFIWRYSLAEDDQINLSSIIFGVYKNNKFETLCSIQVKNKLVANSTCLTGVRKTKPVVTALNPISRATFVLHHISPEDQGIYSIRLEGTRTTMERKTRLVVKGSKPHFLSEPNKVIEVFQGESVNFTWKLSNNSFDTFYFGTWNAELGAFENPIISLTRSNGNQSVSHYTSSKDNVKEYIGRVRWVGDVATGVASFELTNIKHSDQKYYGVEVEFNDYYMTELASSTKLVVKKKKIPVVPEANPCALDNGGCSHLCYYSRVNKTSTCKCPSGMKLSSDAKTCIIVQPTPVPTTVTKVVVTVKDSEANPCALDNGGCSHLCYYSRATKTSTCKCPSGMKLSSDAKTCIQSTSVPTTVAVTVKDSGANPENNKGFNLKIFIIITAVFIINITS